MSVSIKEAMQITGLSYVPIYKSIQDGKIQAVKQEGIYRIPEEELTKLPKPRKSRGIANERVEASQKVEVPQGSPFQSQTVTKEQVELERILSTERMFNTFMQKMVGTA